MKRRAKKAPDMRLDASEAEMLNLAAPRGKILIIGAGQFVQQITGAIREYQEFEVCGILDPAPSLKGKHIQGIPVLGWLGDLPSHATHAVIGTPYNRDSFDRAAVFYILLKRGIQLPIIRASSCLIASDIELRRGTALLAGSIAESGAVIGENCLVGQSSRIIRGGEIFAHAVVMPGDTVARSSGQARIEATPRSLAATLATETESLQEIIKKINRSGLEIVLVTDGEGRLAGTVTDGDIRRGILAGLEMSQPASVIMNRNPISVPAGMSRKEMLGVMRNHSIRQLPVVDTDGKPLSLEVMESLMGGFSTRGAIVMAGGMGSRLRPLTQTTPKPMLSVDGQPILDHILTGLRESGLHDVVISVNYLAEHIKNHVKDGQAHKLNVSYLNERNRLGTAGALSLLEPRPKRPFLVMNGDLLTRMNYTKLLQLQEEHDYDLVMGIRVQETQIPYGVVEIEEGKVISIREKPVYRHFINAGIYVLKPECIDLVPANTYFDMTNMIDAVISRKGRVGAFPVIEYWRDIGTPADLKAASTEHREARFRTGEQTERIAATAGAA